MNQVTLKFLVQGYYNGNGTMRSVKNNQDQVSPLDEVETVSATLWAGTNAVETAEATLKTDGMAVFQFENDGDFHISVKGKNSLAVFIPVVLEVGATPISYDFTIAAEQAYGANQVEVETNVFALRSGSVNNGNTIDQADEDLITAAIENSLYGVQVCDLNGDGVVDNSDLDFLYANKGKSVLRP